MRIAYSTALTRIFPSPMSPVRATPSNVSTTSLTSAPTLRRPARAGGVLLELAQHLREIGLAGPDVACDGAQAGLELGLHHLERVRHVLEPIFGTVLRRAQLQQRVVLQRRNEHVLPEEPTRHR